MSSEVDLLELCKRLQQCAIWLEQKAIGLPYEESTYCKQWAADLRNFFSIDDADSQD
jgi:hypothetical protein